MCFRRGSKKSAVLHLTNPVLWTDEEDCLASVMKADGFDKWAALEVGPGKVLSGLWGNTDYNASIAVLPVNTTESVNNL